MADDFLVVPGEHATVREGRVAPNDFPPEGLARRLQNLRPAHFRITLGRQFRED